MLPAARSGSPAVMSAYSQTPKHASVCSRRTRIPPALQAAPRSSTTGSAHSTAQVLCPMNLPFPEGCLLDPLVLCVTQSSGYLKLCHVLRSTHILGSPGLHMRSRISLLLMVKPADPDTKVGIQLTGCILCMQERRRQRRDRNSLRGIWQGIWRNHPEHEHASASANSSAGAAHPSGEASSAPRLQRASRSLEAPSSRLQSPFAAPEPSLPDYQVRIPCLYAHL